MMLSRMQTKDSSLVPIEVIDITDVNKELRHCSLSMIYETLEANLDMRAAIRQELSPVSLKFLTTAIVASKGRSFNLSTLADSNPFANIFLFLKSCEILFEKLELLKRSLTNADSLFKATL